MRNHFLFSIGALLTLLSGTCAAVVTAVVVTPVDRGFPIPVLVASVIGTIAGISLGEPIEPRRKLFGHAFAYTAIGAASTTFIPWCFGWTLDSTVQMSFAVIVSALLRKAWPAVMDALAPWLAAFNPFGLFNKNKV